MNSEKVKEIKKVLEEGQFNTIKHHQRKGKPILISFADILTLINELESENKGLNNELKRYKIDWLNSEKMHLQADIEDTEFELFCANKSLGEVREKNQQLKDRIAELEKENKNKTDTITDLLKKQEFYEKEKLTKFAERLKEKFPKNDFITYSSNSHINKEIDETLKEFVDD